MAPLQPQGFANLGATPFNNQPFKFSGASAKPYNILQPPTTTPKSNALSAMATGQPGVNMIPVPPKPTTPVKAETTTGVDGATHKVEYQNANTGTSGAVGTNKGLVGSTPATPATTPPPAPVNAGNNQSIQDQLSVIKQQALGIQSGLANQSANPPAPVTPPANNSYGGLVGDVAQTSRAGSPMAQTAGAGLLAGDYRQRLEDAIAANKKAVGLNTALSQGMVDRTKQPIPLEFVTGQQSALQRDYGVQAQQATQEAGYANALAGLTQSGLVSAAGIGNTAQGLQQSGLTGLASLVPELLRYGSENGGSMTAAEAMAYKANLGSASDLATKINAINANKDAASASFIRLGNAAGALGGDTPIAQGLAQLAGTTIENSPSATAFLSQLAIARQQWEALGLGDAMKALPDNITKSQLAQAQQTMEKQIAANLKNLNSTLSGIKDNPTGTNAGGFAEGTKSSDGSLIFKGGKWVKA